MEPPRMEGGKQEEEGGGKKRDGGERGGMPQIVLMRLTLVEGRFKIVFMHLTSDGDSFKGGSFSCRNFSPRVHSERLSQCLRPDMSVQEPGQFFRRLRVGIQRVGNGRQVLLGGSRQVLLGGTRHPAKW